MPSGWLNPPVADVLLHDPVLQLPICDTQAAVVGLSL
jgi:hypothetical protein